MKRGAGRSISRSRYVTLSALKIPGTKGNKGSKGSKGSMSDKNREASAVIPFPTQLGRCHRQQHLNTSEGGATRQRSLPAFAYLFSLSLSLSLSLSHLHVLVQALSHRRGIRWGQVAVLWGHGDSHRTPIAQDVAHSIP